MLEIIIPEQHYEIFDDDKNIFLPTIDIKETKIQLEHSLISLKKWEEKWHKPFLKDDDKSYDETIDYIRCMTLTHNIDPMVYKYIPQDVANQVIEYIKNPMTATWFKDNTLIGAQKSSREIITAEIIYYWMVALNIPSEYQKWHLNQLLTLIKVVSIKNGKPEKVDKMTAAKQRAELNAQRRKKFNTTG